MKISNFTFSLSGDMSQASVFCSLRLFTMFCRLLLGLLGVKSLALLKPQLSARAPCCGWPSSSSGRSARSFPKSKRSPRANESKQDWAPAKKTRLKYPGRKVFVTFLFFEAILGLARKGLFSFLKDIDIFLQKIKHGPY